MLRLRVKYHFQAQFRIFKVYIGCFIPMLAYNQGIDHKFNNEKSVLPAKHMKGDD